MACKWQMVVVSCRGSTTANISVGRKMKLGSKNKWVEFLKSGRYTADTYTCGLRVKNSDGTYSYGIYGVLADFIDPTGWAPDGWDGVSPWRVDSARPGLQFNPLTKSFEKVSPPKPSYQTSWVDETTLKQCKMKTPYGRITVETKYFTARNIFGDDALVSDYIMDLVENWTLEKTRVLDLDELNPGKEFCNVLPLIERYYEQI